MKYQCSVCGEKVDDNLVVYISHTEKHIIDEIKNSHPEWAAQSGVCEKCIEYYKAQFRGGPPYPRGL